MSTKSSNLETLSWESLSWIDIKREVSRIQHRIYKASQNQDHRKIRYLQKRILDSTPIKALLVESLLLSSIRKSGSTTRANSMLSNSEKKYLVLTLTIGKKPRANWLLKLEPSNNKNKLGSIEAIQHICTQGLIKLALEPEWKAIFESTPNYCSKSRVYYNAIFRLTSALRSATVFSWLHVSISRAISLNGSLHWIKSLSLTSTIEQEILTFKSLHLSYLYQQAFPKCTTCPSKIVKDYNLVSLLSDITFYYLVSDFERFVTTRLKNSITLITTRKQLLILGSKKRSLELCRMFLLKWQTYKCQNLSISQFNKPTPGNKFDFLGFSFMHRSKIGINIWETVPSTKSQIKLLKVVRHIVKKSKGSSGYNLIKALLPILISWGSYFSVCRNRAMFRKLDYLVTERLIFWVRRRQAVTKNHRYFKMKYFPTGKTWIYNEFHYIDNWILYDHLLVKESKKDTANMIRLSWSNFVIISSTFLFT